MNIKAMVNDFIEKNKDDKKAEFDKILMTSKFPIKGIKTSVLEDFAKGLSKINADVKDIPLDCHEEIILAGMVIGHKKYSNKEKIKDLKYLIPFIDNWASCDMIVPRLKGLEDEREFFESLLQSEHPFAIRVGIVWIMKFMLKKDLKNVVLKLRDVKNTTYYVEMALSWCYAEAFLYDFDFMYKFIETVPRTVVRNRALQKTCESKRITKEQKVEIRKLRSRLLNMQI